jgi:NDP-mannose synthase
MKAVIVAGGRGTRLKPYTTVFPKPLMPIGNKPIIEMIVRQLSVQNFKEIIIMTGYLGELIMAFLGDGSKYGVHITYSKEEHPLGTIGGLSLIKQDLDDVFLTINGDTLTTLKYSDLAYAHKRNDAIATIALKKRAIPIDFGVVELDGGNEIKGYTEKPTYTNLVSIGVNAFSPEVLEHIELNKYMDLPTLIQNLIATKKLVKAYEFKDYWLDIGRPDDYEKANTDVVKLNGLLGIT